MLDFFPLCAAKQQQRIQRWGVWMGTMSDVKEERRCLLQAPQPSPSPGPRSCCLSGDTAPNRHPTQLPSALWCPGALRKGWTGRRSTPTYAGNPPPEAWQRSLGCLRGSQTLERTPRPWSCPGTLQDYNSHYAARDFSSRHAARPRSHFRRRAEVVCAQWAWRLLRRWRGMCGVPARRKPSKVGVGLCGSCQWAVGPLGGGVWACCLAVLSLSLAEGPRGPAAGWKGSNFRKEKRRTPPT